MKKILITSTDMMMIQFLVPHVRNLSEHGFQVEIACSVVGDRMDDVRSALADTVASIHTVRLERSPASSRNLSGYRDMKRLLKENHYDIIWTNEPVMGVVTRLAARKARKAGTKVVYMCHGFHFFKGAGKKNWLIFYPIERIMAHFCDMIVTINREDEARAKTFRCPRVEYIHGIGVNTERLRDKENQGDIRKELNLQKDDFLLLSIGELSKRKNQQVIIRALGKINDEKIHYLICGKGALLKELQSLAREKKIESNVHFLGYRQDAVDICSQVDLFVLPSLHEGLSVASLEAMYCGLPVVISDIRGARDYLTDGETGYICKVDDVDAFAECISHLKADERLRKRMSVYNSEAVIPYTLENATKEVFALMESL